MPFEKFVPKKTKISRPKATIRPSGLISFDEQAVEDFKLLEATHAVLYFDRAKKRIGIKLTTDGEEEGAIPMARRRRSVSLKPTGFLEQFSIHLDSPKRLDASYDEGENKIVINMTSVRRRPGRPRQRRS
ncbi:MAG TPA: hypothetical protein ENK19_00830 [Acidobacteria bacterium]|nr:hypothetical protein [Acidobacteriota bacterium]